MNDQGARPKKTKKPEELLLMTLNRTIKEGLSSDKRIGAIASMLQSFSLLFREIGLPLKWRRKKVLRTGREFETDDLRIPKQLQRLLTSLRDLGDSAESDEISFLILDVLAGIAIRLEGKLERYILVANLVGWVDTLFERSAGRLEFSLTIGEVEAVQRVLRFAQTSGFAGGVLLEARLKKLSDSTSERFPEVSRAYLARVNASQGETAPLAQMTDPSQSVEIKQLAHILQTAWIQRQRGQMESEIYESILAYCAGFKNLFISMKLGETVIFSRETYEGDYAVGKQVVVKVPPIIWRSEHSIKVVVKGIVTE